MKKEFIAIILAFFFGVTPLAAQEISKATLAAHPRILLHKGDVTAMRAMKHTSENARFVDDKILTAAIDILADAPLTVSAQQERDIASNIQRRIMTLAYAFVMTEDMEYARRAERDMLTISTLEGWAQADCDLIAEYTAALALGYDWLYHSLPVHSRSIIGTAIYERGLRPMVAKDDAQISDQQWQALLYGALATMERSPEFCEQIVRRVVAHCNEIVSNEDVASASLNNLADDLTHRVTLLASLHSALGENCGVSVPDSFMRNAEYLDFMVAPSFTTCNFGGAELSAPVLPVKYWFASQQGNASLVAVDEQLLRSKVLPSAEDMPMYMIFSSSLDFTKQTKRNNSWTAKGEQPLYIYRSGWGNTSDTYFAIKGGGASGANSYSDGGAFIFEWNGVRWAVNPEGEKRGAEWHNTIYAIGATHTSQQGATLIDSFTTAARKGAVVDLSPLAASWAKSLTRTAELDKKDCLKISDHIFMGAAAQDVEWQIMTYAKPEIAGPSLVKLSQDGQDIYLRLHCKNRSTIVIEDCDDANGLKRVGFRIEAKGGQLIDVVVDITPSRNNNILGRLREKFKRGDAVVKR